MHAMDSYFGFLTETRRAITEAYQDLPHALKALVSLAVPRLGDWCAIHLTDEYGRMSRAAVLHPGKDPETGVPRRVMRIFAGPEGEGEYSTLLDLLGKEACLAEPIRSRGHLYGTLRVGHGNPDGLDPDHRFLVAEFARAIAHNLEKQLLAERARGLEARLATSLRNQAESEAGLRQGRNLLQLLVDNLSDEVSLVEAQPGDVYRIVLANPLFMRNLGLPDGAWNGRCIEDILPAKLAAEVKARFRKVLDQEAPLDSVLPGILKPDRWMHTRLSPVRDPEGRITHILSIARDVTDQRRAEEAVQAARDLFGLTLESLQTALAVVEAGGKLVYLNSAFLRLLGMPAVEEAMGQRLETLGRDWEVRDEKGRSLDFADWPIHRALAGETPPMTTLHGRSPDGGREFWWEVKAVPQFGRSGRVRLAVLACDDITERKRAELEAARAQLRMHASKSKAERAAREVRAISGLLQSTLDSLPDRVGVFDAGGRLLYANFASVRDLAKDGRLPVGERTVEVPVEAEEILDEEDRPVLPEDLPLRRALEGHGPTHRILRILNSDGSDAWRDSRAVPIRDPAGRLRLVVTTSRDITSLKKALVDLQAINRRLHLALSAGGVGIWEYDAELDRMTWSERMCEIHGLDKDGYPRNLGAFLLLVHPEDRSRVHGAVVSSWDKGTEYQLDFRVVLPSGEVRWRHTRGGFHSSEEGRTSRVLGATIDITDRKRAEEAARKVADRVRHGQNMEAMGRLAGGISHDFNNILTSILGYADLVLAAEDLREEAKSHVLEIRAAGERAATLIRQLLAFSRRQVLVPRRVDANALLQGMEPALRELAGEGVRLEWRLDRRLPAVRVDPVQLEQAILSLALNAREAMPRGGTLSLATAWESAAKDPDPPDGPVPPGEYVRIEVADTGIGMPPETLARIFEPFFSTKPNMPSSGMGLSMVQGIVRQSGGFIQVESAPGRGTRIHLRFPAPARPEA